MVLVLVMQITSLRERLAEATKVEQGGLPIPQQGEGGSDLEKLGYNMYSGSRPKGSSLQPQSSPALNSQLSVQSEMFRGGEEGGRWAGGQWGGKLGRKVGEEAGGHLGG